MRFHLSDIRDHVKTRSEREPVAVLEETAADPALEALARELASFRDIKAPADARARTWAQMRTQIQSQHERGRFAAAPSSRFGVRRWRWATAAVLMVAAVTLAVVGLRADEQQRIALSGSSTSVVAVTEGASVPTVTSPVTAPDTTGGSAGGSGSTSPGEPESPVTSGGVVPGTTGSGTTGTAVTGTTAPTTSVTNSTNTSGQQMMTKQQRESSARSAVAYVARAVLARDFGSVSSLMTEDARAGLVQMAASLENPAPYSVSSVGSDAGATETQVVLEFTDRVMDEEGQEEQVQRRFLVTVVVDEAGALIAQVYALP